MRVIAVDWSGRESGASEFIWLAEVIDGRLVTLENGRDRAAVVDHVITSTAAHPETVIGLDFAFSFPAWWCAERGWHRVTEVWQAMADDGERLLRACALPLWGRPGRPNLNPEQRRWRRTELDDVPGAKSVFQIGGAGAVGTGSIRGMPHLLSFVAAGYDIWPFGTGEGGTARGGLPRVLEIYPRTLTGPVNKSRWAPRHELLWRRFGDQDPGLLERAAGSEDSFDAAVSALEMARHQEELRALVPTEDPVIGIEGRAWSPEAEGPQARGPQVRGPQASG